MTTASQQWTGGLAPDQQRLLLAALQSNKRKSESNTRQNNSQSPLGGGLGSNGVNPSVLSKPAPAYSDNFSNGTPSLNPFDLGASDSTFDFTAPSTGDLSNTFPEFTAEPEHEQGEKRKSPEDDEDDDDDDEDSEYHRRNSDGPSSKKPGRKPSTSEPTTKRKAQNRAAQRAFRERKEKHLKDLETKVNDLEKASESANHENSVLRVQVDRLNDELRDARRRMSTNNPSSYTSPTSARPPIEPVRSSSGGGSGSGFDFDFDFPRFGNAPGSETSARNQSFNGTHSPESAASRSQSQTNVGSRSPPSNQNGSSRGGSLTGAVRPGSMGGVFGVGVFDGGNKYPTPQSTSPQPLGPSRSQTLNSAYARSSPSQSVSAASRSPGESHIGHMSSACTSPDENWANDYQAKHMNGFSVSGASPITSNNQIPGADFNNSIDWLATQNGGQFDPVLFGDYRESQDNILGNGEFSGGFFDGGLPPFVDDDLFNFNIPTPAKSPAQPQPTKKPNLMEQVERQRDGVDQAGFNDFMMNKIEEKATKMMTCPEVWETLRSSQNFQSGDFDVDALCSDLTSKAKCTESGLSLPRDAVEAVLWKMATRENNIGQSNTA